MPAEHHVRPFAEFLHEQRKGAAHNDASEALNELIAAVVEHRKPGALVLEIKVKPAGKGGNTVFVSDAVKVKLPEGDRPEALFFVDEQSNLSRRDPNQGVLPLRAVDGKADESNNAKEAQK